MTKQKLLYFLVYKFNKFTFFLTIRVNSTVTDTTLPYKTAELNISYYANNG